MWIAVIAVVGVLAVACFGTVAFGLARGIRAAHNASESLNDPSSGGLSPLTEPSSAPPTTAAPHKPLNVSGSVPAGSKASSTRVREAKDLERVCDHWYYPKAPKYTTELSPHPISISVRERKDLPYRTTVGYLDIPFESPAAIKDAWQPKDFSKVQLVACVDLVTTKTPKVKTCPIDKPKPSKIDMKEGRYRLTLYETATRKKLFETRLTGEDETCPLFILVGEDRSVYSTVDDRQLTDTLRRFVEG
ncbi:hypothetical protein [Actinoplanes sp. NPDC049265]|uniref:hypothetical protein n=1 Tax=Actinoplanes sp. NPDC049265 TaxID=3363902 RepID=UPI00371AC5E8